MAAPWHSLKDSDPELHKLMVQEYQRQCDGLEMIASENFASQDVIMAAANCFTNKYAEGLPGKRYYGGCEVVDEMENLCIDRAKKLFSAGFANVQPHSGAQANAAVMLALVEPGKKILGMDLSQGGHLTHGAKVNFSGTYYQPVFYGVDQESEQINYDTVREIARAEKPAMIIAGASAYPRAIDFAAFREIADEVGAYLLVDMAHIAGLCAAGLHSNPIEHAHVVTTTTHKTLRGPRGGLILWNDPELTPKLNKGVFPGTQGGPLEHIIAAKAKAFHEALQPSFKDYQLEVIRNASAFAQGLMDRGFKVVSGGSDNHLVLLSLLGGDISGKQLEEALGKVAITVNKNTVPRETRSPFVTSGVRFGTPAVTTRGLRQDDMATIATWVKDTHDNIDSDAKLGEIRRAVVDFAGKFPLYPEWKG